MSRPKQATIKKEIKSAAARSLSSIKPIKERQTRVEILQHISEKTNLKRVEVEAVFTEMANLIKAHMSKKGSGEILLPKLGVKIRKVKRNRTKERKMVSPLTGQEVVIPSKPAREDVKLIPLKPLKEILVP